MDRVTKEIGKFIFSITLGIIIGIIIGALSLSALVSHRIDDYFKEITYLKSVIEDRDNKLKKLEEAGNSKKYIVKNVEIYLEYEGDEIDKLTLEKAIKEKYNNLIGKQVQDIDIDMVGEIVDKRIMRIDDNSYKLKVDKVLVSEALKLWVIVESLDEKSEE